MDYLSYRRTARGITFPYHLISVDIAHYEIFSAILQYGFMIATSNSNISSIFHRTNSRVGSKVT